MNKEHLTAPGSAEILLYQTEDGQTRLEVRLQEGGEKEVPTTTIGEWVMNELHSIDQVAYVRFASVYRSFKDINEFMAELQDLLKK